MELFGWVQIVCVLRNQISGFIFCFVWFLSFIVFLIIFIFTIKFVFFVINIQYLIVYFAEIVMNVYFWAVVFVQSWIQVNIPLQFDAGKFGINGTNDGTHLRFYARIGAGVEIDIKLLSFVDIDQVPVVLHKRLQRVVLLDSVLLLLQWSRLHSDWDRVVVLERLGLYLFGHLMH